jgi:hypothetical protein
LLVVTRLLTKTAFTLAHINRWVENHEHIVYASRIFQRPDSRRPEIMRRKQVLGTFLPFRVTIT